ncbi:hypothetical protein OEZ85_003658 [Tetradesmus obliquus]|uniref:ADP-ribosylhydrolase ARH3 n=1 Tax=Tetradesmus obliquus TaxID=3088 RepID=A0ABY8UFU9_TETOB|nr:hypothetical protein OEZ85_003658 [Tetradesmus obliquus]
MQDTNALRDRVKGAVLGAIIGDALGVGPHWYYEPGQVQAEFGGYVDTYVASKPGRYHEGVQPGDVSQTGQLLLLLLDSVAQQGCYSQQDYCARLDGLLDTLDGTPYSGRYTDQAMRDVWRGRKQQQQTWGEVGSYADTSEAAIRSVVLAARYASSYLEVGRTVSADTQLTHADPVMRGQTLSFATIVAAIINGEPFDEHIGTRLRELSKTGALPFTHAVLAEERQPAAAAAGQQEGGISSSSNSISNAAQDPDVSIPPLKVPLVYGMACSIQFLLPAGYWYAAFFAGRPDHFEAAVLAAVNSGGNNMARAALTGALVGAMVGQSVIPARLVEGLVGWQQLLPLLDKLAADAFPDS